VTTTKAPAVPVLTLRPFSGAELRRELDELERLARLRRWQAVDRRPGRRS
jgi:hypothetical protein